MSEQSLRQPWSLQLSCFTWYFQLIHRCFFVFAEEIYHDFVAELKAEHGDK
jgi:hypothetical protein